MLKVNEEPSLKRRIAWLSSYDKAMRLCLLKDDYIYVCKHENIVSDTLWIFKSKPVLLHGRYYASEAEHNTYTPLRGDFFLFLEPGQMINLKTMEVSKE